MLKKLFCLCFFVIFSQRANASNQTLIINQVRGQECCSVGSVDHLRQQFQTLSKLNLPTSFTLRYDVLNEANFVSLIKQYQTQFEWGAFLEITPSLAKDAGVAYTGNENNWYEAQIVYLIGYSQADRVKLIETYMAKFKQVLGAYPQTSTAWMIDNFSLQLLRQKYGISIHQITREQMGVDSYTLYGGPDHYPYYPSPNWALVPDANGANAQMPLIVRQTIADPVLNYGDTTSAHTSQPNDYARKGATLSYFKHLFLQAHSTVVGDLGNTFALIGLENSMTAPEQAEFLRQLEFVASWRQDDPTNRQVLSARDFAKAFADPSSPLQNSQIHVYAGQEQDRADEKAWWIDTPSYRARVRLSAGELFVSDLRIYSANWTDPYFSEPAKKLGFWIVPFIIDGSRYFNGDQSENFDNLTNDGLRERPSKALTPTRLTLIKKIDPSKLEVRFADKNALVFGKDGQIFAKFSPTEIALSKDFFAHNDNKLLAKTVRELNWLDQKGNRLFGLASVAKNQDLVTFKAELSPLAQEVGDKLLDQERNTRYPLLFPEIKDHPLSVANTYLLESNRFAMAGRNPVRLVLFPKDEFGYPISIKTEPKITLSEPLDSVSVKTQSGQNGMVFLDFESKTPKKVSVEINKSGWSKTVAIYFAPDCKRNTTYCLKHPQQAWWYLRNFMGDQWRALEKKWSETR